MIYKSWWCAVFPFPPSFFWTDTLLVRPVPFLITLALSSCLNVRGHVTLACAGTETRSYVYSSICIGYPIFNTNWTVIPWRWSLNLFRNISNNSPLNMTPYCSTDLSIRRHHCQNFKFQLSMFHIWPPLWSSGQIFWLQIQRSRVRFPALSDFLSSSRSGTGSTQPREVNWGDTWIKK